MKNSLIIQLIKKIFIETWRHKSHRINIFLSIFFLLLSIGFNVFLPIFLKKLLMRWIATKRLRLLFFS